MPAYGLPCAQDGAFGHCRTSVGAFGGEPIEDATPERRERVRTRAATESPAPEAGCGDDDDAARSVTSSDDHAPIVFASAPSFQGSPLPGGRRWAHRDRRETVIRK